jgi:UPF0716 protein FxsA
MAFVLPLLFLLPIVEMYLLIRVGGHLGAAPTILLVVGAAFLGMLVLRLQGPATLQRVAARLQAGEAPAGEAPAQELAEGALLAAAGLLLLLPGFCSDLAALLLLVPAVRARVAARLVRRLLRGGAYRQAGHVIIEGQFERRTGGDDLGGSGAASVDRLGSRHDRS